MRNKNFIPNILVIFLVVTTLLGVLIAGFSYRNNSEVPRGIAGAITIYLLYYYGRHTKMDVSTEDFLRDPKKGKYFVVALFAPMISYWAAAQIYEMVIFLKTITN